METFCCKTRIIAGKAAREVIREMSFARLLVVADPFFVENGLAESIAQASGAQRWALFGEVMPDPTVELAAKGTAMVKELRPDVEPFVGNSKRGYMPKISTEYEESTEEFPI